MAETKQDLLGWLLLYGVPVTELFRLKIGQ